MTQRGQQVHETNNATGTELRTQREQQVQDTKKASGTGHKESNRYKETKIATDRYRT
jgi:hypothetical protein